MLRSVSPERGGTLIPNVVGLDERNGTLERQMVDRQGRPLVDEDGFPITTTEHGPFDLRVTWPLDRQLVAAWSMAHAPGRNDIAIGVAAIIIARRESGE